MIQTENVRQIIAGNGVTIAFPITVDGWSQDYSDLAVYRYDSTVGGSPVLLTMGADYGFAGVLLLMDVAPTATQKIIILLNKAGTQDVDYVENDTFPAATHEENMDKVVVLTNQLKDMLSRAPLAPVNITGSALTGQPTEGGILGWVSGKWAWLSSATAELAANLLSSSVSLGSALITFLLPKTGAVARSLYSKAQDGPTVFDFMTAAQVADVRSRAFTLDVSAAIQAAWNAGVYEMPEGLYGIGSPLRIPTAARIHGRGFATEIKCLPTWAPAVPTITAATYSPVLAYPPMVYNQSGIQWWSIENIQINGNNEDCYGIWLAENFYGHLKNVWILYTNKRPYTNIRGQEIKHDSCVFYDCNDGVLTWDNTGLSFDNCGFERLSGAWAYDQRHGNNKGGVTLEDCWFESGDAATSPSQGFLRVSGRRVRANIHASHWTTATTERALELNSSSDTTTIDGVAMLTTACVGGNFKVNNSNGAMLITAQTGASYNNIEGFFTSTKVTDNGGPNNWNPYGSFTTAGHGVTGRFVVRTAATTSLPVGATNFGLDVDVANSVAYWFGNTNNYDRLKSGILERKSNAGMRFIAGGDMEHQSSATGNHYFSDTGGASTYAKGHLVLGAYHIWVNTAGKLYIKSGTPASDTDGTVVGTQS